MKKFFITLLILLALGGAGFFFGWVQFSVPPGLFGVIHSKTHGIDQQLVKSGEFRWVWYKLLPTNVKIAVFNLDHVKFPVKFKNDLPSGDTYSNFVGLTSANFSWNIDGEIAFKLKPDSLIDLSKNYNLMNQDDLDAYLKNIAKDIELIILHTISTIGADSERLERLLSGNPDTLMEQEIKKKHQEITDFTLSIQNAKFPDFILYKQIRLLYEEFLIKQREYISSSFGTRAENHIESQLRFEELERYGDLLTKYPILLDYIALEHSISGTER